jgi:DNA polymerase III delta subunit
MEMELHEFQQQIVHKSLSGYYVLSGEEIGIMNIYLNKIYMQRQRLDSVAEAFRISSSGGKFSSPKCFIVRDDTDYLKQEDNWDRVRLHFESSKNILVVVYTKLDKRSKFYKRYQKDIVWFEKLTSNMLSTYVLKELPDLTKREAVNLAELCDNDYSRLMNECFKIKCYANHTGETYSSTLKTLEKNGAIHKDIGDITFELTDSIVLRNRAKTAELLDKAKRKGEPEILLLSVLYNSFKQVLLVQGLGNDQHDAAKRTGLTPYQVKLAKEKQGWYSISELIEILKLIRNIEKGIKTGEIDVKVSIDYAILHILGDVSPGRSYA